MGVGSLKEVFLDYVVCIVCCVAQVSLILLTHREWAFDRPASAVWMHCGLCSLSLFSRSLGDSDSKESRILGALKLSRRSMVMLWWSMTPPVLRGVVLLGPDLLSICILCLVLDVAVFHNFDRFVWTLAPLVAIITYWSEEWATFAFAFVLWRMFPSKPLFSLLALQGFKWRHWMWLCISKGSIVEGPTDIQTLLIALMIAGAVQASRRIGYTMSAVLLFWSCVSNHTCSIALWYVSSFTLLVSAADMAWEGCFETFRIDEALCSSAIKAWDPAFFKDMTSFLFGLSSFHNHLCSSFGRQRTLLISMCVFAVVFTVVLHVHAVVTIAMAEPVLRSRAVFANVEERIASLVEADGILSSDLDQLYSPLWRSREEETFCRLKGILLASARDYRAALSCFACSATHRKEATMIQGLPSGAALLAECLEGDSSTSALRQSLQDARASVKSNVLEALSVSDEDVDVALRVVHSASETAARTERLAKAASVTCLSSNREKLRQVMNSTQVTLEQLGYRQLAWRCAEKKTPDRRFAHALFQRACETLEQDDYFLARQELLRLTQFDPLYAEGWYELGVIQSGFKQVDEAISSLTKSLHLRPSNFNASWTLAQVYNRVGTMDLAVKYFVSAIEHAESNGEFALVMQIRADLCHAILHSGDHQGALSCTEKDGTVLASTRLPFHEEYLPAQLYNHQGIAKALLGDEQKAMASFIKSLEQSEQLLAQASHLYSRESHADAYNNLGSIFFEQGKLYESRQNFEMAIKIQPNHLHAKNNLAKLAAETAHIPFV